jgi:N-acetylglucosamine kinase-like BadF-type ATPase
MLQNKDHELNLELFKNIPIDSSLTIIADSGGTKTSWAILAEDLVVETETTSFHANNLENQSNTNFVEFLKKLIARYSTIELHFYGAGCLNSTNILKTKLFFDSIGLKNNHIKSDLIGAAQALFEQNEGIVGILGTGSVAIHYKDGQINKLIGGLGYLIGDEGSGFYFGKTLINQLLNQKFEEQLCSKLHEILGNKEEIMNMVYGVNGKQFIGSIAEKTNSLSNNSEIYELHRNNLKIFIETLQTSFQKNLPVGIIGSYGYNNQTIINELFQSKNIPLPSYISHPIKQLIKRFKQPL